MASKIIPLHRCVEVDGEPDGGCNVRRFPRTMTGADGAFRSDPRYARAIEGGPRSAADRDLFRQSRSELVFMGCVALCAVAFAVMATIGWLPGDGR